MVFITYTDVTINHCDFENNNAEGHGGAIFFNDAATNYTITAYDTKFKFNHAQAFGNILLKKHLIIIVRWWHWLFSGK